MMNYSMMPPIKGIINSRVQNQDFSFANSVLQCLVNLPCLKSYFLNQQNINNFSQFNLKVSKSFYLLINSLQSGLTGESYDVMFNYFNSVGQNGSKTDPYHFLFFFLEVLNWENNQPSDPYFDLSQLNNVDLNLQTNKEYMKSLFCTFFQKTQNSIISQCFYNVVQRHVSCTNCNNNFYSYVIRKILYFEVEQYRMFRDEALPHRKGQKLDLDECFQCFTGGLNDYCPICQNFCAKRYKKLMSATQILMIYLNRKEHCYYDDIDFRPKIDITKYIDNSNGNFMQFTYTIRSCISLDKNGKYFSFCFIPVGNNQGKWFKFIDDQVFEITKAEIEIHTYEPIILFYEKDNINTNNFQNPFLKLLQLLMQNMMFKQQLQRLNFIRAKCSVQNQMMNYYNHL